MNAVFYGAHKMTRVKEYIKKTISFKYLKYFVGQGGGDIYKEGIKWICA